MEANSELQQKVEPGPNQHTEVQLTQSQQQRQFQRIKASKRQFNLKPQWLTSTDNIINKASKQLSNIEISQKHLQNQLKDLDIKKKNFDKISQKKHEIIEYTQMNRKKNRKMIESMHPMVMVQVYEFITNQPFLLILKHRKISKYFNFLSRDDYVVNYFGYKLLGLKYSQSLSSKGTYQLQKQLISTTKQYVFFLNCFKYYKQLKYQKNLPKNSFLNDLVQSLEFINHIFQLSLNDPLQYQTKINDYLIHNRGTMAFENLSLMNVPVLQMNALQALINHIAVNDSLKANKCIQSQNMKLLLRNEEMRIHVFFNAKIVNILYDKGYQYSLVKTHKKYQICLGKSVNAMLITILGHNLVQFVGEVIEEENKSLIMGSNYDISVRKAENKRFKGVVNKQEFEGISTLALVNNQLKPLYIYLNQDMCMILNPF